MTSTSTGSTLSECDARRTRKVAAAALGSLIAGLFATTASLAVVAPEPCFGRSPTIVGTPGDDTLVGTPRVDVIDARDGDDVVHGKDGHDRICGRGGNDTLRGGRGFDLLRGGRPSWEEFLWGGRGDDLLIGGGADPNADGIWTLRGGPGDDRLLAAHGTTYVRLIGGWGNDRIDTRDGSGSLHGGPGDDLMRGRGYFAGGAGDDFMRGDGESLVSFRCSSGVRVDLEARRAFGAGHDIVAGMSDVYGSGGNDAIYGNGSSNYVVGGRGSDRISGRAGRDSLEGREGDDRVHGGPGDDYVFAAPGNDVVTGGTGDDQLSNEYSPDRYRDPQATQFRGGSGHDYFVLYLFPTTLRAQPVVIDLKGSSSIGPNPLYVFEVEDVDVGSNSRVEVRGNAAANRVRVDSSEASLYGRGGDDLLEPSASKAVLDGGSGVDTGDFTGPSPVFVDLVTGTVTGPQRAPGTIVDVERVIGSWDSDAFNGDGNANYFFGASGDDTANGGGGDDVLDGWTDTDTLDGGDGMDQCFNGEVVTNCE